MDMKQLLDDLNNPRAAVRNKALQEISQVEIKKTQKEAAVKAVLAKLTDLSITVQRQAIKTLSTLGLADTPDELKILFKTSEDSKLKTLILSCIRRIKIEAQRSKTGEIEWQIDDYVFSVSDFVSYINALLNQEIVRIKGEVSDISVFRESLVFFSLKDRESVVNCWFPKSYQYRWGVELQEGVEVVIKVKPQVSPRSGRFALRVLEMSLSGQGALRLALEKLKAKLEKQGLFDPSRKRPLPWLPRNIGLITGENSAAYSDFIKVLGARMGGLNIYFAPVRVQGVGSIAEICRAIAYFNTQPIDLIVLTRGGGSLEDLQAFNSQEVTRAVFSSQIPIVVAVGHEKDWSLAELAADLRASTPSNAAELIVPPCEELAASVSSWVKNSEQRINQLIQNRKQSLCHHLNIINNNIKQRITHHHNLLKSLNIYFNNFVQDYRQKQLSQIRLEAALLSNFQNYYSLKKQGFESIYKLLLSYSPREVLKRGYSVVKLGQKIVKSAQDVKTGDEIKIWPYEGIIISEVKNQKSNLKDVN
jgi:exodeoxyribonuclease VII large subunit